MLEIKLQVITVVDQGPSFKTDVEVLKFIILISISGVWVFQLFSSNTSMLMIESSLYRRATKQFMDWDLYLHQIVRNKSKFMFYFIHVIMNHDVASTEYFIIRIKNTVVLDNYEEHDRWPFYFPIRPREIPASSFNLLLWAASIKYLKHAKILIF